MTRLQTVLLIVLGLVTAALLAQADWFQFLPIASAAIAIVVGWVGHIFGWLTSVSALVPGWVWWAAFGILFSRFWVRGSVHFRGGCCASHRRHWKAASETV